MSIKPYGFNREALETILQKATCLTQKEVCKAFGIACLWLLTGTAALGAMQLPLKLADAFKQC